MSQLTAAGVLDIDIAVHQLLRVAEKRQHDRAWISGAVRRLIAREPLAYVLGEWDFDVLSDVIVRRPSLIPRPETEELVAVASSVLHAHPRTSTIIDAGTGSGVIAAALLKRHTAIRALAYDTSLDAVQLARENASLAGVADRMTVQTGDTFSCNAWSDVRVPAPADMIVTNPPYVLPSEMPSLAPELGYEDVHALQGIAPLGCGHLLNCASRAVTCGVLHPSRGHVLAELHPLQVLAISALMWDWRLHPSLPLRPATGIGAQGSVSLHPVLQNIINRGGSLQLPTLMMTADAVGASTPAMRVYEQPTVETLDYVPTLQDLCDLAASDAAQHVRSAFHVCGAYKDVLQRARVLHLRARSGDDSAVSWQH